MENFENLNSDSLIAFILKHGKENIRFIEKLSPLRVIPLLGVAFTSSMDPETDHECVISEDRYQVEGNYKITLVSLVDGQRNHFYTCDLASLIRGGSIKMELKPAFLN